MLISNIYVVYNKTIELLNYNIKLLQLEKMTAITAVFRLSFLTTG